MRPDILAESLGQTIRGLVGPVLVRVAALEAAQAHDAHTAGVLGTLERDLGQVRARVQDLEARPPVPGPPGPAGPAGRDGVNGTSLTYRGVHVPGQPYVSGDLVTHDGSAWYCNRPTDRAPGSSTDWQLMVKRGRDARGAR